MNLNDTKKETMESLLDVNETEPRTSVKISYILSHIFLLILIFLISITITISTNSLLESTIGPIKILNNAIANNITIFAIYFVLTSIIVFIYKRLDKLKLAHKKFSFLSSVMILSVIMIVIIFVAELF